MKKIIPVIIILVIGIFLGLAILKTEKIKVSSGHEDEHGHNEHEEHSESGEAEHQQGHKGEHGGKVFSKDNFTLELAIFEKGVPPEFRVYIENHHKPVSPDEVKLIIELNRFAGKKDIINFKSQKTYLLGDKTVEEPHSFDVSIKANWQGKDYQWQYSSYEGRTELSFEEIIRAGIAIEKAGPVKMEETVDLPAEIIMNSDRVSHVVPQISGVVTDVFKNLGDKTKKGETIAIINSRELADAKSEYIESIHHLELVKDAFNREEILWKKKISSEENYFIKRHALEEGQINNYAAKQKLATLGLTNSEINSLELNPNQNLARYEIHSPFTGTVIEKHISMGEAVKPDSDIFIISDLSTVWANITVYAKDSNYINLGQKIKIKNDANNTSDWGKIIYIGSLVGKDTRTAKVYALINNKSGIWKPGTFITANLVKKTFTVPVAVKESAIQTFRDWNVVFLNSENQFEVQPVELGRHVGNWVEVKSGLLPGQKYAVNNSYILKADIEKSGASHDH